MAKEHVLRAEPKNGGAGCPAYSVQKKNYCSPIYFLTYKVSIFQSSAGQELEDDGNASIMSVKERARHLNRIESETELQKTSSSNLGAVRKKDNKRVLLYSFIVTLERSASCKISFSTYQLPTITCNRIENHGKLNKS